MKPINNLIATTFSLSILLLTIFGCNKEEIPPEPPKPTFSVQFVDGYGEDYGWVILYNTEGTEILDYKEYVGDATIDFGEISNETISVTIVKVDTVQSPKKSVTYYYDIDTDHKSPSGKWILTGFGTNETSLGQADMTLNYPNNGYTNAILTHSDGSMTYGSPPATQINLVRDIYELPDNNKFSVYGSVYTATGGLCNWALDQNFQMNSTNYYIFDLNQSLNINNIGSTKELQSVALRGYWNDRNSNLLLFQEYLATPSTNLKIMYPHAIPVDELNFSGVNIGTDWGVLYNIYYDSQDGLPGLIEFPESYVTAEYNNFSKEVYNINVSGTADQLSAWWGYNDLGNDKYYNWEVFTPTNVSSIKKPPLPQDIIQEIGNFTDLMEIGYVRINDYNTTSSHADVVQRFFIDNVAINQRFDESYLYIFMPTPKYQMLEIHDVLNFRER